MKNSYHVVGSKSVGYGVRHIDGYMEYDLLESRTLAKLICEILNQGIGPQWDAIEDEIDLLSLSSRIQAGIKPNQRIMSPSCHKMERYFSCDEDSARSGS